MICYSEHIWCISGLYISCLLYYKSLVWFGFRVASSTFRIRSWSSTTPSSLPVAWAIRFPATKLPTSMEAGPTSTARITDKMSRHQWHRPMTKQHNHLMVPLQLSRFTRSTWLFLARLGHVGHTGVRAHENIAGVQISFQEVLLGFTDVDASERCFRERVGWHKGQAVQANLVDTVNGLRRKQWCTLERLKIFNQIITPGDFESRQFTCSTLLIHWKLSSSLASGLCSATITILSS